jgi:selT/selW/selH-like putative selenoprotein
MAVTKERFEQGLTYNQYKEQMTRNRERFDANEETVTFDPVDLAYFKNLPQTLNVLVLAEDWCGDVINNLPVVGRLAEESGKLNVRVFLRDQNLDIMDQYLNRGEHRSIPTVVFFDRDFNDLGHWIERPARVSEMQAEMRRGLFANDPILRDYTPSTPFAELSEEARERLRDANAKLREQNRALFDQEVVRELRALLEHGVAQSAAVVAQGAPVTLMAQNGGAKTTNGRPKVSITYCAECGYEPQTLALTSALMHEFIHDLSAIELIPWQDGAFDVMVNGDLVFSMYRDGGFPAHNTIIQAVRERMG